MNTLIDAAKQALEALESNWNPDKERAITALRQAIDQAELAKPVAYMSVYEKDSAFNKFRFIESDFYPTPVYTAPPRKEWVGLTVEDKNDCLVEADPCEALATPEAQELMRSVEAKLRGKNDG